MGRTASFAVCVFLTVSPWVGAKTPDGGISVEDALGSPMPSSLTASADGTRLAWVFSLNGVANVWTARSPELEARAVTTFASDDGRPLQVLGFSPDGESVFFSKSARFNPDSRPLGSGPSAIYRVGFDGGDLEILAEADWAAVSPVAPRLAYLNEGNELWIVEPGVEPVKILVARGELTRPSWSPDGARLVMSTIRGEFPHRYAFITVVDPGAGEVRYLDPSVFMDVDPVWSPDGSRVAFLRRLTGGHRFGLNEKRVDRPDPWEVRVADLTGGETRQVWRSPDDDSFFFAAVEWWDDERVVFRSEASGWRHLYLASVESGKVRQLTDGEWEVESFRPVRDRGLVVLTANRDDIDRRHIWSVDADGDMRQLTSGRSIEWSPVPLGDGGAIAHLGSTATSPAHVFLSRPGEQPRRLAPEALPATFPSERLIEPEQAIFETPDGWTIHGQLFLPPARFEGRRPAILFFHGGPIRQMLLGFHYSGYYHRSYAMNQVLASRGYVVLSVNYRLGIGYGRAFRDVPDGGPRGCSEYRDLLAAAKLLRSHPRVDPDRMGLWGGSYGGLMTALGLARNSDLFRAGVDLHGVHDWNQWQAWVTGEANDHDRTEWRSSPVADLDGWRSAVLLIHGDDDRNVPFSETKWLAERLRAQKVDVELLVFPDDVHGFLLHRNWVRAFEAAVDFFDRRLGDPAPGGTAG